MLKHISEEPSLPPILREISQRIHRFTHPYAAESQPALRVVAAHNVTEDGVPLVLPFDRERRLIPRLLHRLRKGRFLKNCPASLAEYKPLSEPTADYLLHALEHTGISQWRERLIAVWGLGSLPADHPYRKDASDLLADVVQKRYKSVLRADKKRIGKVWAGTYLAIGLPLICYEVLSVFGAIPIYQDFLGMNIDVCISLDDIQADMIAFIAAQVATTLIGTLLLSRLITYFVLPAWIPLDLVRANRIRAMAITTLGRWRDAVYLPLLLRESLSSNRRIRLAAEAGLVETLPLLTTEDYGTLPGSVVPDLCLALQRKERQLLDRNAHDETLTSLVLEAIGKVGDERALHIVTRMAHKTRTPALRQQAAGILPILLERQRLQNDPKQLLRGAIEPAPAPETLLRPASHTPTPPETLLRAAPPSTAP